MPLYDQSTDLFRFRNDSYISIVDHKNQLKFQEVQKIINANTIEVSLEEKACLIINNKKIFHGRNAFKGNRLMHRVLVYRQ